MLADRSIMVTLYKLGFIMISIYVDNLLIAATSIELIKEAKKVLSKEFNMKDLREVRMIIEMQIIHHQLKRLLTLDQALYIQDVLLEESLLSCNTVSIPIVPGLYIILKEENDRDYTEITTYQQLIEKLLYIACETCPDVAFTVGCLSQQCSDPQIGHIKAIRRVLQYLKKTMNLEIHYNSLYDDT